MTQSHRLGSMDRIDVQIYHLFFKCVTFAVNVSIVPYDNAMVTSDIILIIVLTELTSELEVSILTTAHISSLKL